MLIRVYLFLVLCNDDEKNGYVKNKKLAVHINLPK